MWTWIIIVSVAILLIFVLLAFIGGLITLIPLPISKAKLANEIEFVIDLTEGRHPEVTHSDPVDLAFNQRIWNNELEKIRQECIRVRQLHPTSKELEYCDAEGIILLKKHLLELKAI